MMCEKTTKSENHLFQKALSFFIKGKIMGELPYLKKNNSRENPFWTKDFEERVKSHIFALENLPFLRIRISLEKA